MEYSPCAHSFVIHAVLSEVYPAALTCNSPTACQNERLLTAPMDVTLSIKTSSGTRGDQRQQRNGKGSVFQGGGVK